MTPTRILIIVIYVLVVIAIGVIAGWWDRHKRDL